MKKILFLFVLGWLPSLQASQTTTEDQVKNYIELMKGNLDTAENEVKSTMLNEGSRFSIVPLHQREEWINYIKNKVRNTKTYRDNILKLNQYELEFKRTKDDHLEEFFERLKEFQQNTLRPFARGIRNESNSLLNDFLRRVEFCPKDPLTREQWTSLKNNQEALITVNGREKKFYVKYKYEYNFPNMVQIREWNALMQSIPKAVLDEKTRSNIDEFSCDYQYRSTITGKEYIIRIWSKF